MTGPLVAAGILVAALIAWLLRPRRRPAVEPWETDTVEPPDPIELDRAERAIRDRERISDPDGEVAGDDWGPGAPQGP
ncbi:MAG: hypothetical protein ACREL4_08525 [Gemmatimonadales bacterium]